MMFHDDVSDDVGGWAVEGDVFSRDDVSVCSLELTKAALPSSSRFNTLGVLKKPRFGSDRLVAAACKAGSGR